MPANVENSAVATGLGKVSFHSNSKEGQCQGMFKLPYNCTHFTYQQDYAQNPSSQGSAVCELRTSRCGKQRSNCQHVLDHRKSKGIPKKISFCFIDYAKAFDCVHHNKLWKILKEMGIPDHLTCLLRNLYAEQEVTIRMRHGTMNWFQTGKGVCQEIVYCHPAYLTNMQSIS